LIALVGLDTIAVVTAYPLTEEGFRGIVPEVAERRAGGRRAEEAR
jgi:hypothetical protein